MTDTPATRSRVSTSAKVLVLLEAVASSGEGVGVRALARETGLDKSAVSRLLEQLASMGAVEQSGAAGRFEIGPRLYSLAAAVHGRDSLSRAGQPILRQLVAQFNESCYLATRERYQVVFRERVDCDQAVRYVIEPGAVSPLHAGAAGRAVLAGMRSEEVEEFIGSSTELEAVTEATITDPLKLRSEVERDKARGYSVSVRERVTDGCAVAAPFFNGAGLCYGSLVLTSPADRFDVSRIPEMADKVIEASRDLSFRLGWRSAENPIQHSSPVGGPADDK